MNQILEELNYYYQLMMMRKNGIVHIDVEMKENEHSTWFFKITIVAVEPNMEKKQIFGVAKNPIVNELFDYYNNKLFDYEFEGYCRNVEKNEYLEDIIEDFKSRSDNECNCSQRDIRKQGKI